MDATSQDVVEQRTSHLLTREDEQRLAYAIELHLHLVSDQEQFGHDPIVLTFFSFYRLSKIQNTWLAMAYLLDIPPDINIYELTNSSRFRDAVDSIPNDEFVAEVAKNLDCPPAKALRHIQQLSVYIRLAPLFMMAETVDQPHLSMLNLTDRFATARWRRQVAAIAHRAAGIFKAINREGDDAIEAFAEANLGLVNSVLSSSMHQFVTRPNLDLDDARQAALLGLLEAVRRFNFRQGTKFSTYATWCIRRRVRENLREQMQSIYLPARIVQNVTATRHAVDALKHELKRSPTTEEICAETGLTAKQVATALRQHDESQSIDVHDDNLLWYADPEQEPEAVAEQNERMELLYEAMGELPLLSRQLLVAKWGLLEHPIRSEEELAKQHNLSLRQIRVNLSVSTRRLEELLGGDLPFAAAT